MCTVSWLPGGDGYTLCFNRDERLTRAPATPPAERETLGVKYLAPLDGDFGGTWLAVNEFGLSLGVLNRYRPGGYTPPAEPVSRGLLALELISHRTANDALTALEARDLTAFAPFSMTVVEPGLGARLACWDGVTLCAATHRSPGLILTSSSVTEPEVAAARRAAFDALDTVTEQALIELHRSHLPERGRCSICMHREDAETQSFSLVNVEADMIRLTHTPEAPCRGTALPPLALIRRQVSCPTPH
jgi:hypothetical protein